MKLIIYDKNHIKLDELTEFDNPIGIYTLNGVNKFTFTVPLNASKTNEQNLKLGNHLEFYENDALKWFGIVVSRSFKNPTVTLSCYGYAFKLSTRRLRAKEYPTLTYGDLIERMLDDVNSIADTGIRMGIKDSSIKTTRIVQNKHFAWDKMTEYCDEMNYYISIDKDRNLNFQTIIEQPRDDYYIKWGYDEFDNVIKTPSVEQSLLEMANSVYGEVLTIDDLTISHEAKDTDSINSYGLLEGVVSFNDGVNQEDTVVKTVEESLSKRSWPLNTITVDIVDSIYVPLDDIKVGYTINIYFRDYFEFRESAKILEITRNFKTKTATITLGQTIYRDQKPQIKIYK